MRNSNWKETAELIGIAAIVASLVFVGFQFRQEHEIARSEVWSERNLIRAELASLVSTNSEIWVKGLQGAELTDADKARFTAIANLLLYKQSTHYLQRDTGISPGLPEGIALQLVDMLESYPGLKAFWMDHVSYHRARASLSPFHLHVERLSAMVDAGEIKAVPIDYFYPPQ